MFGRRKKTAGQVEFENLPRHIAIIMDGNGRWARRRGMPRKVGHSAGAAAFRTIATYCQDIGIQYLTVYAFSTENWKRPADEVSAIMELLEQYLGEAIEEMEKKRVKMKFLGDTSILSEKLKTLIAETEEISKKFDGVQVNICLNYGGRDEILHAARRYAQDYKAGLVSGLDEKAFGDYLYTAGIPDPDLIIRPSGEMRLSNFLIWQSAYAEFYSTDVLWPDFTKDDLNRAIIEFQGRNRRFGDVK